jgi:hypothetical protein
MGVACGVAAAVGMFYSSQSALSHFARTVTFLKGTATHSIKRPAGPLGEALLTKNHPSGRGDTPHNGFGSSP